MQSFSKLYLILVIFQIIQLTGLINARSCDVIISCK
ncbi:hypothetical protein M6B38_127015 [Iris pallida]|uniref:Uncharacterized protein n=1 Tax=Iris pallida TaxID=29817 RepID=A0AAX6GH09_IRIPA|nr:hypothetical protein M6B38_127015 [Iris pallida]